MSGLLALDATDQLAALARGEITAAALLEAELARYETLNPALNAVINTDLSRAREDAAAIDAARAAGKPLGPLAGLPMTVKDTYDVEGMPASAGIAARRQRDAVGDADAVSRVRAAGAVIWGKTNCPIDGGDWQSYNPDFGASNNPWDPTRTTGGSSGGAAAVLASQITALEIGSDIAGSLRLPAAYCGVLAHKPTWNLVNRRGEGPPFGARSPGDLTVSGPMARSVRDLALLLSVLTGGQTPPVIPPADPAALKVGLWLDDAAMLLDPAVRKVIAAFAERARAGGVQVMPMASPVDAAQLLWTYNRLLMARLGAGFPQRAWDAWSRRRDGALAELEAGAGPLSYAATVVAATGSHRDWVRWDEDRHQLGAQMAKVFETVDVIVTPVAPVEAFAHDHSDFHRRTLALSDGTVVDYASMKTWAALAITLGLPATAIPAGLSPNGLPIGVQVVGPCRGDAATLAAAALLEQACGGYQAPPGMALAR